MLFNSFEFLVFAAVFFAAWPLLRGRKNSRWGYLVVASFVFYGWWDARFLLLICGNGLLNFLTALGMVRWPRARKAMLIASIAGNVGSLAAFKYLDFAIRNVNWLLAAVGAETHLPLAKWILPVGISFYTFQAMSYTIDVYRRELAPTRNVLHFFAYLAMFPQLVAGPIVRAAHLLPQLASPRRAGAEQRWAGLQLIARGFFKKVVVADTLAPYVNEAFRGPVAPSCGYWWLIMLMFAYQIYCDFSGYSDIARGLGKWMGFDFPVNFDHPYIAGSFREFWQRWHISLSTWFRDYLYIPLGGSRRGAGRAYAVLWITLLVSGLWHGAAWAFVLWAAAHAALMSIERVTHWPRRLARLPGGRHVATLTVFVLTLLAWVLFRCGSTGKGGLARAGAIFTQMFRFGEWNFPVIDDRIDTHAVNVMLIMIARQLWFHFRLHEAPWSRRLAATRLAWAIQPVVLALLLLACVYLRGPGAAFIYFQF